MYPSLPTHGHFERALIFFIVILAGAFGIQAAFVHPAAALEGDSVGDPAAHTFDVADGIDHSTMSSISHALGAQTTTNDGYEPNDDFDSATSISEGTYSDLEIVDGESDYFAISVDAGESIAASIDFSHSTGDLDLELYGPDQESIDLSNSISDGESVSATQVSEGGTYYMRAYGFGSASAPYDLTVDVEGSTSTSNDAYEPNDDFDSAAFISEGTYTDLQIVDGESDYFAVTVDAGQTVEASIDFSHSTGDLDMQLYGPDREVIESSSSVTDDEVVSVEAAGESGTYYIRIYGYVGASAPYDLDVNVAGSPDISNDGYEPNDDIDTAAPISDGILTNLQIVDGESDYFALTADAGDTIEASIEFAHSTGDLDMELYGPNEQTLDSSFSVSDGESVSASQLTQSGTYYIHVYGLTGESASYDLDVTVDSGQSLGQIHAAVVDGNNAPVSGATVRVEDQSGSTVVETTTGESGEESLEVPVGEYTVVAEYDGEQTQSAGITVNGGSGESVELVLEDVDASDDSDDSNTGGTDDSDDSSTDGTDDSDDSATEQAEDQHRGFFNNDPDSSVPLLDDPFNLTLWGFILSIAGILMQLSRGD